jgi:hypothetical protein
MDLRKTCSVFFGLSLVAMPVAFGTGCAERRHMVTQTRVEESATRPPPITAISIIDLHDEPSTSPTNETVVGTIVNQGDKPVSQLSIQVNALDGNGRVVNSVVTPPLPQTIGAFGGRAQFQTEMPKDPTVTAYHAVAVAR